MDSKMCHFICFILLMSLEGLKADNHTNSMTSITPISITEISNYSLIARQTDKPTTTPIPTTSCPNVCSTTPKPDESRKENKSMFGLDEVMLPWVIILFLLLICLIQLLINMCLLCKHCRRTRDSYKVIEKSPITTRRSSINGGPSEIDIMLKDYSSVKVEIETTPDEPDEPQEVAGTAAKTENQVSGEESKTSASDTGEAVLAQEVKESGENELKD